MLRLCTNDQVTLAIDCVLLVVNPGALDADNASKAYEAYDAVPCNDPVNEPDMNELDTNNDPVITADPENGKPTPAPDPEM